MKKNDLTNAGSTFQLPEGAMRLNCCKKNQIALLTTRKAVKLNDELRQQFGTTKIEIIYSRYVRLKCDYLKLLNHERARAGLEPLTKTGPLPWGEWIIKDVLLGYHLPEDGEQRIYLRYYPWTGGEYDEKSFLIDGRVTIDYDDDAAEPLRAKMIKPKRKPLCCNVEWGNIVELELCNNYFEAEYTIVAPNIPI